MLWPPSTCRLIGNSPAVCLSLCLSACCVQFISVLAYLVPPLTLLALSSPCSCVYVRSQFIAVSRTSTTVMLLAGLYLGPPFRLSVRAASQAYKLLAVAAVQCSLQLSFQIFSGTVHRIIIWQSLREDDLGLCSMNTLVIVEGWITFRTFLSI